MVSRKASSRLQSPTKAQLARDGETRTKAKLEIQRKKLAISSSNAAPSRSPKSDQRIDSSKVEVGSPKSQGPLSSKPSSASSTSKDHIKAKSPKDDLPRSPNSKSKTPNRRNSSQHRPPKQPVTVSLSTSIELKKPMARNQHYLSSPDSSIDNSLEHKYEYSLSNSLDFNYSLSESMHKIDDSSNHKSFGADSLFGLKVDQTMLQKDNSPQLNDSPKIQGKGSDFGNDKPPLPQDKVVIPRFELEGSLDDHMGLTLFPIKSPALSGDAASVVSALTFEYANLEAYNINLDMPEVGKEEIMHEQSALTKLKEIDGNKSSQNGPKKSERLNVVHEKVVDLRRENVELKKTNLQLMTQAKLRREKEKKDELNSLRLNTITEKVANMQAEHQMLREANENLLLQIDKLESKSIGSDVEVKSNKARGSDDEDEKVVLRESINALPLSPKKEAVREKIQEKSMAENKTLIENYSLSDESFDKKIRSRSESSSSMQLNEMSTTYIETNGDKKKQSKWHFGRKVAKAHSSYKEQIDMKEKVTELEFNDSQQKRRIEDLERQLKEKNLTETNLEYHIEKLNNEMINLRRLKNLETEELRDAYNELKDEASQVVDWLKKQLADNQSKHRAEEIAKAVEDNDLESLTKSEREHLLIEIEEERKKWIGDLGGSPSRLDIMVPLKNEQLELSILRGSDSIDGSTITNPLSPLPYT